MNVLYTIKNIIVIFIVLSFYTCFIGILGGGLGRLKYSRVGRVKKFLFSKISTGAKS